MLLWRPSERNKYLFLLELVAISTGAHLVLGFFLFVVYKGGVTSFRIDLGKSHSQTLFMPLKKHVGNGHARTGRRGRGGSARAASKGSKRDSGSTGTQRAHNATIQSAHTEQQAYELANPVKEHHHLGSVTIMGWDAAPAKTQYGQDKSSVREKKLCKKNKKKKGKACKKQQAKKQTPKKAVIQKKQEPIWAAQPVKKLPVKKPEPYSEKPAERMHAEVPAIKAELPVAPKEQTTEEVASELQVPDTAVQPVESQGTEVAGGADQEGVGDYGLDEITLGQEYDGEYITAEQARMYECVEQEIVSRWRPPRGFSKDLACQIKCSVGGSGTVVACKIEKPSGVLIYDMAARSAARAMMLPRWAWGKEFTIIFKQ